MLQQKEAHAMLDLNDTSSDMTPLFDAILKYIPAPEGDPDAGTQLLISTIDYNEYVAVLVWAKWITGKLPLTRRSC